MEECLPWRGSQRPRHQHLFLIYLGEAGVYHSQGDGEVVEEGGQYYGLPGVENVEGVFRSQDFPYEEVEIPSRVPKRPKNPTATTMGGGG